MLVKKLCDKCKNYVNNLTTYKGESMCGECYRQSAPSMPHTRLLNIEEALEKTYMPKPKTNTKHAIIKVPIILSGRKLRLILDES